MVGFEKFNIHFFILNRIILVKGTWQYFRDKQDGSKTKYG